MCCQWFSIGVLVVLSIWSFVDWSFTLIISGQRSWSILPWFWSSWKTIKFPVIWLKRFTVTFSWYGECTSKWFFHFYKQLIYLILILENEAILEIAKLKRRWWKDIEFLVDVLFLLLFNWLILKKNWPFIVREWLWGLYNLLEQLQSSLVVWGQHLDKW